MSKWKKRIIYIFLSMSCIIFSSCSSGQSQKDMSQVKEDTNTSQPSVSGKVGIAVTEKENQSTKSEKKEKESVEYGNQEDRIKEIRNMYNKADQWINDGDCKVYEQDDVKAYFYNDKLIMLKTSDEQYKKEFYFDYTKNELYFAFYYMDGAEQRFYFEKEVMFLWVDEEKNEHFQEDNFDYNTFQDDCLEEYNRCHNMFLDVDSGYTDMVSKEDETGDEVKEDEEESTSFDKMVVEGDYDSWQEGYRTILERWDPAVGFTLFDMDLDGIPELILSDFYNETGEFHFGRDEYWDQVDYHIYTYISEKNQVRMIGLIETNYFDNKIPCVNPEEDGIFAVSCNMGKASNNYLQYTVENHELVDLGMYSMIQEVNADGKYSYIYKKGEEEITEEQFREAGDTFSDSLIFYENNEAGYEEAL